MHNRLPADLARRIEAAIAESNRSQLSIARKFGVSMKIVNAIAVQRGSALRPNHLGRVSDPTPEEIAERCAEIRRGWKQKRERYSFPTLSQL